MPTNRTVPAFSQVAEPFDRRNRTPRLWDRPAEAGVYRRRILVRSVDDGHTTGELEDDFHHFRVDLRHDGTTVTNIDGSGLRGPWTTCMDAGVPLREVEGVELSTHPTVLRAIDARRNCTHMFDLAGLMVTHAARRVSRDRRYDIEIADSGNGPEECTATLWRDGVETLTWELREREISAPDDWVGAPLRSKFIPWACERFAGDDDAAEAAIVLRRTIDISRGRMMDLDGMDSAEPLLPMMEGICHSMTSTNAPVALRNRGSARDFTAQPELLLADFEARR